MNKNPNNSHSLAKTYIIFTLVSSICAIISPHIVAWLARSSNGSEVGVVLLLPVLALYVIAGALGLASLVVTPIFLFRKFFAAKFIVLAVLALVSSVYVAATGLWQLYQIVDYGLNIENNYKRDQERLNPDKSSSYQATYEGLTEQAALDKAKSQGTTARVVERDGEALPVTMDYSPGRVNLYLRSGKVYKTSVE